MSMDRAAIVMPRIDRVEFDDPVGIGGQYATEEPGGDVGFPGPAAVHSWTVGVDGMAGE